MNAQELKQRIDRIEDLVDEAKDALEVSSAPQALQQAVESLHQQAREAKHSNSMDEGLLRQAALRIEQAADQAKDACAQAGNAVDPQAQQAVLRAHEEASRLKKEIDDRITKSAEWAKENLKAGDKGTTGGVGGGKGEHGSNHSGHGDGKGQDRKGGDGKGGGAGTGGGGGMGTGGGDGKGGNK